ncbi:MAG TPA: hypothetical protein VGS57_17310 [Thermoanaerobaculia bacterium]|jgi:hypothetical protein|nr:hypothetical protein [Thermoanaerobaculia bacterium]
MDEGSPEQRPLSHRNHRRGARSRALALAAFALALFSAAAQARDLTLTFTPDLPTWADSVRLRVAGEVTTSCGSSVMHLANVRKPTMLGTQLVVQVDLVEDTCTLLTPPITVPFVAEADLGHLLPGSTIVRVHDLAFGAVAQQTLLVYDVSRLGLETSTATSNDPVALDVTYYDGCSSIVPQVDGHVITLTYTDGCYVLPPPPFLTRNQVYVGPLPPGDYEVRLVEPFNYPGPALKRVPLHVWDAAGCVPTDDSLCLHDGRFRLRASWRAFDGSVGNAHAAPLPGNDGTGLLWFFAPDNAELTVKVLDACGVDGHWWVFVASASTVEYTLTVTDTKTGAERIYRNALGNVPDLIADTGAFACP